MTRASVVGLREGDFLALDASAISDGSVDLRRAAGRVGDDGAQVSNGWRALTDVYQSPAAPGLVTAMEPVGQIASEMSGAMRSATIALDDYARAISSLQARHRSVAADAGVFSRAAAASPDWRIEPTLRAQQSSLQRSVATLESDFDDARQQCVAVLDGIVAPAVQTTGSFASQGQGPEGEGRPGDGWWDPRHLFTSLVTRRHVSCRGERVVDRPVTSGAGDVPHDLAADDRRARRSPCRRPRRGQPFEARSRACSPDGGA